jgi:hypothetical protein
VHCTSGRKILLRRRERLVALKNSSGLRRDRLQPNEKHLTVATRTTETLPKKCQSGNGVLLKYRIGARMGAKNKEEAALIAR